MSVLRDKVFRPEQGSILCPKCGTVFHAARSARAAARVADGRKAEVEKDEAEVISLSEVEEGENKPEAIEIEDDVEIDTEEADDTFLEEEEGEEDDVAGLIDGDINTDEEG